MSSQYSTITSNVSLLLVNTTNVTSLNPYVAYVSSVSLPGRIATIRDATGNCTSNRNIIVSTLKDVHFSDGTNSISINQPFGYITLSSRDKNTWSIINTFAFPHPEGLTNVSSIYTDGNITTKSLFCERYISTPYINVDSISTVNLKVKSISSLSLEVDSIRTSTLIAEAISTNTIIADNLLVPTALIDTLSNVSNIYGVIINMNGNMYMNSNDISYIKTCQGSNIYFNSGTIQNLDIVTLGVGEIHSLSNQLIPVNVGVDLDFIDNTHNIVNLNNVWNYFSL